MMSSNLKVATLNLAGINLSPFEYYDGSEDIASLSNIFQRRFAEANTPKEDLIKIALIDKKFQKDRYCPLYNEKCGVVRGHLLDRAQFDTVWSYVFEQHSKILEGMDVSESQSNHIQEFDWIVFQTIIEFVYGAKQTKENPQYSTYDSKPYQDFMKTAHSKSFLKSDTKVQKLVEFIKKEQLDVMFLQQIGDVSIEKFLPKEYLIKIGNQSAIIYNTHRLKESRQEYFQQLFNKKLDINNETTYMLTPSHLLISSHLTSRAPEHVNQANQLFKVLSEIKQRYPHMPFIIGIDSNHYLSQRPPLDIYPKTKEEATTCKKRSFMQCQFNKANLLVREVKDHIVTNQVLSQFRIVTASGGKTQGQLLPNERNPYDHFFVVGKVTKNDSHSHPVIIH